MAEDREYLQQLALYCLHRNQAEQTAAFLAEYMAELALSEGHAKLHLSANQVLGILRTLERLGEVKKGDGAHSTRNGRAEPTWRPVLAWDLKFPMPEAPEPEEHAATAAAGLDPFAHMSREQLIALVQGHDDISSCVAGFRNDVRDLVSRFESDLMVLASSARRRMAKLGVE